jgi:exoribonuclease R
MSDAYEGFLPVRKIPSDHYDLNETDSALIGSRSGRRLGFGDRIEVQVESVEAPRGRVDLTAPDGKGGSGSGRGSSRRRRRGRR